MNQQQNFYYHAISLFGSIILLFALFMATIECLLFYVWTQNLYSYYGYIGTLVLSAYGSYWYYRKFTLFRANLDMFFNGAPAPLNMPMVNEELCIKACLLYQQGASFTDIKTDLQLSHVNQAKRLIQKGLSILLIEHKQKANRT
jgi:hypothetical protein